MSGVANSVVGGVCWLEGVVVGSRVVVDSRVQSVSIPLAGMSEIRFWRSMLDPAGGKIGVGIKSPGTGLHIGTSLSRDEFRELIANMRELLV